MDASAVAIPGIHTLCDDKKKKRQTNKKNPKPDMLPKTSAKGIYKTNTLTTAAHTHCSLCHISIIVCFRGEGLFLDDIVVIELYSSTQLASYVQKP